MTASPTDLILSYSQLFGPPVFIPTSSISYLPLFILHPSPPSSFISTSFHSQHPHPILPLLSPFHPSSSPPPPSHPSYCPHPLDPLDLLIPDFSSAPTNPILTCCNALLLLHCQCLAHSASSSYFWPVAMDSPSPRLLSLILTLPLSYCHHFQQTSWFAAATYSAKRFTSWDRLGKDFQCRTLLEHARPLNWKPLYIYYTKEKQSFLRSRFTVIKN